MKNQPIKLMLALTMIVSIATESRAEATFGQASDFFNIGAGARALAMGSAFTGVSDDASAPYYNPAGLAYLDEHQLMLMHAPLQLESSYNYLATAHPFGDRWGTLALSDALMISQGIETRDRFNTLLSSNESYSHNALFASYARKLTQKWAVGGNAKFIQQRLVGASGSDLGLDLGVMYKPLNFLTFGANFMNVNSPSIKLETTDDVYRPVSRFGASADVFRNRLTLAADIIKTQNQDNLFAAGLEFAPTSMFRFRTGYNENRAYTLGLGVNLKSLRVDYAFANSDLGALNKVSITWAWHNIYKTELEPPMKEGRAVYPLAGFENKVVFHSNVPDQSVATWKLDIKDRDGKAIRTLSDNLRPPTEIAWDARNSIGEPVVDGKYLYTFTVNYRNGKSWTLMGDLDLALPDPKVGQGSEQNLELNGAKATEQPASIVQHIILTPEAQKIEIAPAAAAPARVTEPQAAEAATAAPAAEPAPVEATDAAKETPAAEPAAAQ